MYPYPALVASALLSIFPVLGINSYLNKVLNQGGVNLENNFFIDFEIAMIKIQNICT